jgi:hypothetical protein
MTSDFEEVNDPDRQLVARVMIVMLLIADCVLILQVEKWFAARHGSYVEGLTPRMFSSVDLSSSMMFFLMVTVIIAFVTGVRTGEE